MFIFQKKVHDLEIQLTAIVTSEQHYSEQVKELKTELENEKYVFFFFFLINLFIYGCVGSSFLCEGFL